MPQDETDSLPPFDEVIASQQDVATGVGLVAEVLLSESLNDDFAISLLHRHFTVGPKEYLLTNRNGDALTTMVCADDVPVGHPIAWRVNTVGELAPYEFTSDELPPLSAQSIARLQEAIGAKISNRDLVKTYGFVRRDFLSPTNEVQWHETTDAERRISTKLSMPKTEVSAGDLHATIWVAEAPGKVGPITFCRGCKTAPMVKAVALCRGCLVG